MEILDGRDAAGEVREKMNISEAEGSRELPLLLVCSPQPAAGHQ
jgi:hypothetical protein